MEERQCGLHDEEVRLGRREEVGFYTPCRLGSGVRKPSEGTKKAAQCGDVTWAHQEIP